MKALGLHHVNIVVDDLDAARSFYGGVLGLSEDPNRPDFGSPGAWYDLNGGQLHISVGPKPDEKRGDHFAMQVGDCAAVADEVEAAGISVLRIPKVAGAGTQIFFRDPAGNLLEMNQPD